MMDSHSLPTTTDRLVCIGHSHTETVSAAAKSQGVPLEVLNFWHLPNPFVGTAGALRLVPAIAERLVAPVFSLIGGAVHQDVGLVLHPRPFDFVWPGDPDLPLAAGAEIVPFDAVHAALFERTQHYRDIMDAVRAATDGPVFHLESPPTYEAEELPQDDPGFFHMFGQDAQFSPAWFRFKLWRAHSAIIADHCAESGITFLPHPPEAVDARGFLRAAFHGTPAHANAAYGALLLRQMRHAADAVRHLVPAAPVPVAPLPPRPARHVEGSVDGVRDGAVHGWAVYPGAPDDKPIVELVHDGRVIGDAIAVLPRPDVAALGHPEACGFAVPVDAAFRRDWAGGDLAVQLRVRGGTALRGENQIMPAAALAEDAQATPQFWPPLSWPLRLAGLTGFIDRLGPDHIDGWAQNTRTPSAPVVIDMWEDGVRAGSFTANIWRKDLEETRQGDGRWALSAPVPQGLRDGRLHRLELRLPEGDAVMAMPVVARFSVRDPAADGALAAPPSDEEHPSRRSRPARDDAPAGPLFSIIVVFYNMPREAARTLTSLTRAYQRGIGNLRYEVLCVDNGSDPPLDAAWVSAFGPEFRLVRPTRILSSPCAAINEAAAQAHGRFLAIMIDGAHILTPGVLREVWDTITEAPDAVVALRSWFVGGDQRWLAASGYERTQEDMLFDKIAWPSDGYRLFSIGESYWESPRPWFDAMIESNCLFLPATLFRQIGGMDEDFAEAGAGYANLDLFRRAADATQEPVVALIGEATFHQFHDGTTTNAVTATKEARVRAYESHYVEMRGKPFPVLEAVDIRVRGQVRTLAAVASRQRPSSPARIGVTDGIRPGSLALHFDRAAQDYVQTAYVENGLHEQARWLGQTLGMAPSDALALQDLVFRLRPGRIVAVNQPPGVIALLDSVLRLAELPASRILAVAATRAAADTPCSATHIIGHPASSGTLAQVEHALDTEEHVMVVFTPDEGDMLPIDALRAYAGFVTPRSYLVFAGTAFGQPWLGYSRRWYHTAIQMLVDLMPFAIDHSCNPHLVSTSPLGYLQRIENPAPLHHAG
jgi:cephalosporin hydroxylase/GT2 family glycosyltransferase